MSFVIDVLLLAICACIIISGYRKGVVKSVLDFATIVISLVATYAFSPFVSAYLYNNVLITKIAEKIQPTINSIVSVRFADDFKAMFADIPADLAEILNKYNADSETVKIGVQKLSDAGEVTSQKVSELIASPVATVISNVIAFIAVFLVVFAVLKIVSALIVLLFKAPVLKTADKLAGVAIGILSSVILLWVLGIVLSSGVEALGSVIPDKFGRDIVDNSVILGFFEKYNPLGIIRNIINV